MRVLDQLIELFLGQVDAAELAVLIGRAQQGRILRDRLAEDGVEYLARRVSCGMVSVTGLGMWA